MSSLLTTLVEAGLTSNIIQVLSLIFILVIISFQIYNLISKKKTKKERINRIILNNLSFYFQIGLMLVPFYLVLMDDSSDLSFRISVFFVHGLTCVFLGIIVFKSFKHKLVTIMLRVFIIILSIVNVGFGIKILDPRINKIFYPYEPSIQEFLHLFTFVGKNLTQDDKNEIFSTPEQQGFQDQLKISELHYCFDNYKTKYLEHLKLDLVHIACVITLYLMNVSKNDNDNDVCTRKGFFESIPAYLSDNVGDIEKYENPNNWSTKTVGDWLTYKSTPTTIEYIDLFKEKEIDGKTLLSWIEEGKIPDLVDNNDKEYFFQIIEELYNYFEIRNL